MTQFFKKAVSELTMSTQFLQLENNGFDIEIDVQALMFAEKTSEDAWINITPILKAYNARFDNWIRNNNVQEYVNERNNRFLTSSNLRGLKIPFPKSQWYKKSKFSWLENDCPLICTRSGRYHSGTWLHQTLFLKLIMILDVKTEVSLHEAIEGVLKQAVIVKLERAGTKTLFHELTHTIKNIYIPAQESDSAKKFAYANLMNLANLYVLGCSAKKYCNDHDIEVTKKMDSVRDALPDDLLDKIKIAEKYINGFILFGDITSYDKLKEKLFKLKK